MARKKKSKNAASLSWCWYCDRSFEDDKVLLQHQKAKHFRCPHCPRRLNTAGGLAVHIDQVHKLGTDRIENALPGRDSFDVEIYGMEGIPAPDLAAWKKRVAEESGDVVAVQRAAKKPKVINVVLSMSELAQQLANHKALMAGLPLPLPGVGMGSNGMGVGVPPPGFGIPPPPMGVGMPPFIPPPPMGMPFPPPPFPLPPGIPPPPGGMFPFPPPPGLLPLGSSPFPPPPLGAPFQPPPFGFPPPPGVSMSPLPPSGPAALRGAAQGETKEKLQSSQIELKPGTMLVYGDNEISPEEKRAKLSQYKVVEDATSAPAPAPAADPASGGEELSGGRKRARATDFLE